MRIKKDHIVSLFLISSALGVAISYGKIYFFHLMLVAVLCWLFILLPQRIKVLKDRAFYKIQLHSFFYFMFAWYLLSVFWSINYVYSFKYLFYIFCGSSIALTIIYSADNSNKLKGIFKIFAIVFIVEIVLSLLESFTPFRLPVSPYSPYVVYFGRSMGVDLSVDDSILATVFSSPTGFRWNPNNLAVTMSIIFPFFLLHRKKRYKILGSVLIFIIVFMTGSRGVLVMMLLSLLIYLVLFRLKALPVVIILSTALIFIGSLFIQSNFDTLRTTRLYNSFEAIGSYLGSNDSDSNNSIGKRQILIKQGFDALIDSKGLGIGGGGSVANAEKFVDKKKGITSMHNFWIEVLVDSGILFTLLLLVWYFYLIVKLYSIARRTESQSLSYFAKSCTLSLIVFFGAAISASSVIYLFPMWILFGFSIATIRNSESMEMVNNQLST